MSPDSNIVLIVLDTLREDYARPLDQLEHYGFEKYQNTIATSPWTLPSHVSLFTGELPSTHGIHETRKTNAMNIRGVSTRKLKERKSNLLPYLEGRGYSTYCTSTNPFVVPWFGFNFQHVGVFNHMGSIGGARYFWNQGLSMAPTALSLLRERNPNLFLELVPIGAKRAMKSKVLSALKRDFLEKGSYHSLRWLRQTRFDSPFFLYVNLMEPHEPYKWSEHTEPLHCSILGRTTGFKHYPTSYQAHANYAIARAFEMISVLLTYDPLVIVTSDHGQLLGEGGRYGHGYYLDDELLRVPLYIRYPRDSRKFKQNQNLISLTVIPELIRSFLERTEVKSASDFVYSESYGPQLDLGRYARIDEGILSRLYARRIKISGSKGSIQYNTATQVIERLSGNLPKNEIEKLIGSIPKDESQSNDIDAYSSKEELGVTQSLKDWGYA